MEKMILIEGTFTAEEAKEVLMNVFSTKINFHQVKNLSSKERFGIEDPHSLKRLPELNKCLGDVLKLTEDCRLGNKKLVINADISITISD